MSPAFESPPVSQRTFRSWQRSAAALLLVIAVLLAYAPVLGKSDLVLDDHYNIATNPYLANVSGESIAHFWTAPYIRLYIPVTYTAWSLLAKLAGDPPPTSPQEIRVLHGANILLQVANTLLVLALLQCCGVSLWAAFFGALIFAVHPLQTEAVSWITELKTVLSAFFSFATMLFFVLATRSAAQRPRVRIALYLGSLLLLVLGIFSKPLAVCTLPFLFIISCVFQGIPPLRSIRLLTPHAVLCLAVIFITMQAQPLPFFLEPLPFALRLPVALDAVGFYLSKLFVPVHLAMDYARTPSAVWNGFPANGFWALPLLTGALLFFFKNKRRQLLACLALFMLGILPVSGMLPFGYQVISTVADRYAYFAMFGAALALGIVCSSWPWKILATLVPVIGVLLISLTFQQSELWKKEQSLGWHSTTSYPAGIYGLSAITNNIPASPHSLELLRTHLAAYPLDPYNTGSYARHLLQWKSSRQQKAHGQKVAPQEVQKLFEQGVGRMRSNDRRDAWMHFMQAILLDPDDAASWNNLGILLAEAGYGMSEQCFKWALFLMPDNPYVLNNMGMVSFTRGNQALGLRYLERAVRLNDTQKNPVITANLAAARQAAGQAAGHVPSLVGTPILHHPDLREQ